MMRLSASMAVALALWSAPAFPQTAQHQEDTTRACLSATKAGRSADVSKLAEEIMSWRNIFSNGVRSDGAKCLSAAKGEPWVYSTIHSGFLTAKEDADLMAAALNERAVNEQRAATEAARLESERAAAAARLETIRQDERRREMAVAKAVAEACVALYQRDAVMALTNSTCVPIFYKTGLPE